MSAWWPRGRARWTALAIGVAGLLGCLLTGWGAPRQALLSYLFAFVFFTGLTVGSLALALVHVLTGGAWGHYLRPPMLAAMRLLPLMAVLALPLLLGMGHLYLWTQPAALASDPVLRKQGWYLNPTFFVLRTVVYFAAWMTLAALFRRRIETPSRLPRVAAPGLIVFALTALLAATDWTMSLLPHWHSTTYGMLVTTGWMLAAAALATLQATCRSPARDDHPPALLHDLGNLLLMFVLGWGYLAFMQYLTVWIADLPAETVWYIPRTLTSWRWLAWVLVALQFVLPFVVLLSRKAKRHRAWMGAVAGMMLVGNLVDALWLVVPNFRAAGLSLRWTDLMAVLGIGGLWLSAYLGQLATLQLPIHGSSEGGRHA